MVAFCIAGDEAYVCSNHLLAPIPGSLATDAEDAFHFYHSSLRMHVEQAFGIFVKKFKILKRLEFPVADYATVIVLKMKLHNFSVDHGQKIVSRASINMERVLEEHNMMSETRKWYSEGKHSNIDLAAFENL